MSFNSFLSADMCVWDRPGPVGQPTGAIGGPQAWTFTLSLEQFPQMSELCVILGIGF